MLHIITGSYDFQVLSRRRKIYGADWGDDLIKIFPLLSQINWVLEKLITTFIK